MKRVFDVVIAAIGLIVLSPLLLAIAVAVKLDSPGPILYRGARMGKDSKIFHIHKFRTMAVDAAQRGGPLTRRADPRVTRIGRTLRHTKLDELPQLYDVLRGEMSLVGPRPEDPHYLQYYSPRQRLVLSVRPGLTSIASIRYRNEEELLAPDSWERTYIESILPAKLDIELSYLMNQSLGQDSLILFTTLVALVNDETHFNRLSRWVSAIERVAGRYGSWVTVDVILVVVAHALAIAVRALNARLDYPGALLYALGGMAIYIGCNYFFGIYRRFWRYAGAQESVLVFASALVATLLLTGLDLLLAERVLPLGAIWVGGFFSMVFMIAARYRLRLGQGAAQLFGSIAGLASGQGARVLIVGAGEEGQLLAWQLQNRFQGKGYQVVGFIDDNRSKHGMYIHNAPIHGGRGRIPEIAAARHVDLIMIAIPPLKVLEPRELLALCRATTAQVKIMPSLFAWLGQPGSAPGWEDASDDDFLQRTVYKADDQACRQLLSGRAVMVTGAAGSIGSELCRQIAFYAPAKLLLVDFNESGLYDLEVELRARFNGLRTEIRLCDITNEQRVRQLLGHTRPQILFHAAAYKHVHILEAQPEEAVRVNVGGTWRVHRLAEESGVERFVLISTDKAVNPGNAYGMSKWLCEQIVRRDRPDSAMRSSVVRFGNVLGSRGSVIPTFERQISLGGPITITDPEATRYYLSIGEAVSLVIHAAALTRGGDQYILDMGVPIKTTDLAHRVIRMHGLRPGRDIEIKYIGLRPGEKLGEELVAPDETTVPTEHPSVFQIRRLRPLDLSRLDSYIDELVSSAQDGLTPDAIRNRLAQVVAELQASSLPPALVTAPVTERAVGELIEGVS